jgi:excisionase family DNA binding protein
MKIEHYRRALQDRFDTLVHLSTVDVWEGWQIAAWVEEAQLQGCQFGLDPVAPETPSMTPRDALPIIGKLLAALPKVPSPYLDSDEAADYLRITGKSLYALVDRKRLTPLRGPRRTYRFTHQQLDNYLADNPVLHL